MLPNPELQAHVSKQAPGRTTTKHVHGVILLDAMKESDQHVALTKKP